ncbi:hypothetical protein, partial [Amycolatopsis minnesotensis]|uniref:hypothetical protein n=1 Tax=Amycolatopsis minnesotensis TaxID=337894 RepID=UPI0031D164D7
MEVDGPLLAKPVRGPVAVAEWRVDVSASGGRLVWSDDAEEKLGTFVDGAVDELVESVRIGHALPEFQIHARLPNWSPKYQIELEMGVGQKLLSALAGRLGEHEGLIYDTVKKKWEVDTDKLALWVDITSMKIDYRSNPNISFYRYGSPYVAGDVAGVLAGAGVYLGYLDRGGLLPSVARRVGDAVGVLLRRIGEAGEGRKPVLWLEGHARSVARLHVDEVAKLVNETIRAALPASSGLTVDHVIRDHVKFGTKTSVRGARFLYLKVFDTGAVVEGPVVHPLPVIDVEVDGPLLAKPGGGPVAVAEWRVDVSASGGRLVWSDDAEEKLGTFVDGAVDELVPLVRSGRALPEFRIYARLRYLLPKYRVALEMGVGQRLLSALAGRLGEHEGLIYDTVKKKWEVDTDKLPLWIDVNLVTGTGKAEPSISFYRYGSPYVAGDVAGVLTGAGVYLGYFERGGLLPSAARRVGDAVGVLLRRIGEAGEGRKPVLWIEGHARSVTPLHVDEVAKLVNDAIRAALPAGSGLTVDHVIRDHVKFGTKTSGRSARFLYLKVVDTGAVVEGPVVHPLPVIDVEVDGPLLAKPGGGPVAVAEWRAAVSASGGRLVWSDDAEEKLGTFVDGAVDELVPLVRSGRALPEFRIYARLRYLLPEYRVALEMGVGQRLLSALAGRLGEHEGLIYDTAKKKWQVDTDKLPLWIDITAMKVDYKDKSDISFYRYGSPYMAGDVAGVLAGVSVYLGYLDRGELLPSAVRRVGDAVGVLLRRIGEAGERRKPVLWIEVHAYSVAALHVDEVAKLVNDAIRAALPAGSGLTVEQVIRDHVKFGTRVGRNRRKFLYLKIIDPDDVTLAVDGDFGWGADGALKSWNDDDREWQDFDNDEAVKNFGKKLAIRVAGAGAPVGGSMGMEYPDVVARVFFEDLDRYQDERVQRHVQSVLKDAIFASFREPVEVLAAAAVWLREGDRLEEAAELEGLAVKVRAVEDLEQRVERLQGAERFGEAVGLAQRAHQLREKVENAVAVRNIRTAAENLEVTWLFYRGKCVSDGRFAIEVRGSPARTAEFYRNSRESLRGEFADPVSGVLSVVGRERVVSRVAGFVGRWLAGGEGARRTLDIPVVGRGDRGERRRLAVEEAVQDGVREALRSAGRSLLSEESQALLRRASNRDDDFVRIHDVTRGSGDLKSGFELRERDVAEEVIDSPLAGAVEPPVGEDVFAQLDKMDLGSEEEFDWRAMPGEPAEPSDMSVVSEGEHTGPGMELADVLNLPEDDVQGPVVDWTAGDQIPDWTNFDYDTWRDEQFGFESGPMDQRDVELTGFDFENLGGFDPSVVDPKLSSSDQGVQAGRDDAVVDVDRGSDSDVSEMEGVKAGSPPQVLVDSGTPLTGHYAVIDGVNRENYEQSPDEGFRTNCVLAALATFRTLVTGVLHRAEPSAPQPVTGLKTEFRSRFRKFGFEAIRTHLERQGRHAHGFVLVQEENSEDTDLFNAHVDPDGEVHFISGETGHEFHPPANHGLRVRFMPTAKALPGNSLPERDTDEPSEVAGIKAGQPDVGSGRGAVGRKRQAPTDAEGGAAQRKRSTTSRGTGAARGSGASGPRSDIGVRADSSVATGPVQQPTEVYPLPKPAAQDPALGLGKSDVLAFVASQKKENEKVWEADLSVSDGRLEWWGEALEAELSNFVVKAVNVIEPLVRARWRHLPDFWIHYYTRRSWWKYQDEVVGRVRQRLLTELAKRVGNVEGLVHDDQTNEWSVDTDKLPLWIESTTGGLYNSVRNYVGFYRYDSPYLLDDVISSDDKMAQVLASEGVYVAYRNRGGLVPSASRRTREALDQLLKLIKYGGRDSFVWIGGHAQKKEYLYVDEVTKLVNKEFSEALRATDVDLPLKTAIQDHIKFEAKISPLAGRFLYLKVVSPVRELVIYKLPRIDGPLLGRSDASARVRSKWEADLSFPDGRLERWGDDTEAELEEFVGKAVDDVDRLVRAGWQHLPDFRIHFYASVAGFKYRDEVVGRVRQRLLSDLAKRLGGHEGLIYNSSAEKWSVDTRKLPLWIDSTEGTSQNASGRNYAAFYRYDSPYPLDETSSSDDKMAQVLTGEGVYLGYCDQGGLVPSAPRRVKEALDQLFKLVKDAAVDGGRQLFLQIERHASQESSAHVDEVTELVNKNIGEALRAVGIDLSLERAVGRHVKFGIKNNHNVRRFLYLKIVDSNGSPVEISGAGTARASGTPSARSGATAGGADSTWASAGQPTEVHPLPEIDVNSDGPLLAKSDGGPVAVAEWRAVVSASGGRLVWSNEAEEKLGKFVDDAVGELVPLVRGGRALPEFQIYVRLRHLLPKYRMELEISVGQRLLSALARRLGEHEGLVYDTAKKVWQVDSGKLPLWIDVNLVAASGRAEPGISLYRYGSPYSAGDVVGVLAGAGVYLGYFDRGGLLPSAARRIRDAVGVLLRLIDEASEERKPVLWIEGHARSVARLHVDEVAKLVNEAIRVALPVSFGLTVEQVIRRHVKFGTKTSGRSTRFLYLKVVGSGTVVEGPVVHPLPVIDVEVDGPLLAKPGRSLVAVAEWQAAVSASGGRLKWSDDAEKKLKTFVDDAVNELVPLVRGGRALPEFQIYAQLSYLSSKYRIEVEMGVGQRLLSTLAGRLGEHEGLIYDTAIKKWQVDTSKLALWIDITATGVDHKDKSSISFYRYGSPYSAGDVVGVLAGAGVYLGYFERGGLLPSVARRVGDAVGLLLRRIGEVGEGRKPVLWLEFHARSVTRLHVDEVAKLVNEAIRVALPASSGLTVEQVIRRHVKFGTKTSGKTTRFLYLKVVETVVEGPAVHPLPVIDVEVDGPLLAKPGRSPVAVAEWQAAVSASGGRLKWSDDAEKKLKTFVDDAVNELVPLARDGRALPEFRIHARLNHLSPKYLIEMEMRVGQRLLSALARRLGEHEGLIYDTAKKAWQIDVDKLPLWIDVNLVADGSQAKPSISFYRYGSPYSAGDVAGVLAGAGVYLGYSDRGGLLPSVARRVRDAVGLLLRRIGEAGEGENPVLWLEGHFSGNANLRVDEVTELVNKAIISALPAGSGLTVEQVIRKHVKFGKEKHGKGSKFLYLKVVDSGNEALTETEFAWGSSGVNRSVVPAVADDFRIWGNDSPAWQGVDGGEVVKGFGKELAVRIAGAGVPVGGSTGAEYPDVVVRVSFEDTRHYENDEIKARVTTELAKLVFASFREPVEVFVAAAVKLRAEGRLEEAAELEELAEKLGEVKSLEERVEELKEERRFGDALRLATRAHELRGEVESAVAVRNIEKAVNDLELTWLFSREICDSDGKFTIEMRESPARSAEFYRDSRGLLRGEFVDPASGVLSVVGRERVVSRVAGFVGRWLAGGEGARRTLDISVVGRGGPGERRRLAVEEAVQDGVRKALLAAGRSLLSEESQALLRRVSHLDDDFVRIREVFRGGDLKSGFVLRERDVVEDVT